MGGISGFAVDITTLALARGIMQVMLGCLLLYLGTRHVDAGDAKWWATGFLLNGASLIVFPFELPEGWDRPRTVLNHLTLGVSSLFFLIGFWKFSRQPVRIWMLVLLLAFPITSLTVWEFIWPNARYRVLCTVTGQVLFLLALQHVLARPPREEVEQIYRRLRYVIVVYIVVYVWSYASIADLLPITARQSLDYHRSIFSIASLLFMLALAVGCLALQFAMLAARNADLSRKDWLTGLLNRRGFFDALRAYGKSVRSGAADAVGTSVLAIDIDHFKEINDRLGHAMGDYVLRQFGGLLSAMDRDDRLIARIGGEEFVIVLFGTSCEEACDIAERLRAEVERGNFSSESEEPVRFTISVGVYELERDEAVEQTLVHADQALYRAKESGRNRVVSHESRDIEAVPRHFRAENRAGAEGRK